MIEDRKRLLRGSFDRQTSQSQHSEGTPVEVPVPKNRISIKISTRRGASVPSLYFVSKELSRRNQTLAQLPFRGMKAGEEYQAFPRLARQAETILCQQIKAIASWVQRHAGLTHCK